MSTRPQRQAPPRRLFVALPVPPAIREQLKPLIPAVAPDVRPTAPEDLHLTLHFLGDADEAAVVAALDGIAAGGLSLRLGAPARFRQRSGRSVLHIAVESTPALDALHRALARALEHTGYRPERRPFRPHLTLARLGAGASDAVIGTFLGHPAPSASAFECPTLALYASEANAIGPRYRVLRSFPLARAARES